MAIADFRGLFQKHSLQFMKVKQEDEKLYSFFFQPEKPFDWKPGQHGSLKVNGKGKPFTIGSTPKEGQVRILTEITNSEFKQSLLNLKEGDAVTFNGPISNFYVKDVSQQHLFIADSVGVIAFRSILRDLVDRNIPLDKFHFLYFTSSPLFMALWEEAKIKGAVIQTIIQREEFEQKIEEYVSLNRQSANYFISGKPDFSKSIVKLLKENDVTKMTKDIFMGY